MVKVTHETLECDVCNKDAERYTVSYPDGIKILDRCPQHAKKILALKDEAGGWSEFGKSRRGKLQVLTPEEISRKRRLLGDTEWS